MLRPRRNLRIMKQVVLYTYTFSSCPCSAHWTDALPKRRRLANRPPSYTTCSAFAKPPILALYLLSENTSALDLFSTPASIRIPRLCTRQQTQPILPHHIAYFLSYLIFAGGSILGTNSSATYPTPTNATRPPAAYFHQLPPMMMQPTKT